MSHAHRRAAVFACAALAAAVAAIPAFATNTVRIDSRVTISERPPNFHGHVRSDNDACESKRRVKLFRERRGPDKLLGRDRSNDAGRWVEEVDPLKSGAYYARVVRREEGTAGTIFVCKGDRSETVVID
jgi:hypothetical protein